MGKQLRLNSLNKILELTESGKRQLWKYHTPETGCMCAIGCLMTEDQISAIHTDCANSDSVNAVHLNYIFKELSETTGFTIEKLSRIQRTNDKTSDDEFVQYIEQIIKEEENGS